METRKNHKTADVSQVLDAASTASSDVQKAQGDMAIYHWRLMGWAGLGWGPSGPEGTNVGSPHMCLCEHVCSFRCTRTSPHCTRGIKCISNR